VYVGFALILMVIGSGFIPTVTPFTSQGVLAFLVILSGIGAGMVSYMRYYDPSSTF
jgi:hypothetical protein